MTARGFQGTQRSAHKMPNSVSILLRNQCDFCFSNANAGRWPAVLVFTKTKYAVGLFYASEHHTSLLGLQPSFLGAEGLRWRPHEGPMLRGRSIDFFVGTMGTRPATSGTQLPSARVVVHHFDHSFIKLYITSELNKNYFHIN